MKKTIIWASIFLASTASAQRWVSLGTVAEGEMFMDIASLRPQGQYMKAWTRYAYKDQQRAKFAPYFYFWSSKSLQYFDCKNGTSATKQNIFYPDRDGMDPIVQAYSFPDAQLAFDDPVPGSFGQAMQNYACSAHR